MRMTRRPVRQSGKATCRRVPQPAFRWVIRIRGSSTSFTQPAVRKVEARSLSRGPSRPRRREPEAVVAAADAVVRVVAALAVAQLPLANRSSQIGVRHHEPRILNTNSGFVVPDPDFPFSFLPA